MTDWTMAQVLFAGIVIAPGLVFLMHAVGWALGWAPRERAISRASMLLYVATSLAMAALGVMLWRTGAHSVTASWGDWFRLGDYEFPLILFGDTLSLTMMALTLILTGTVGMFSVRYLHRERGFGRFFALMHLFAFGSNLAFAAGSFDLLIGGWELVGISSVFLVAFFHERPEPVRSATRVFATYRGCDIGLLAGVTVLHHAAGAATYSRLFSGRWPAQTELLGVPTATIAGLLLLLAASGKSAQAPFSGWLPLAMEGPTPSSAIFYGAISVHAGAYLLLRAAPMINDSVWASGAVVLVGAVTAVHAMLVGRTCADTKTALAYATMAQLGLIFVEIGLGFEIIALLHIVGHSILRTLEFLSAPSMLREYRQLHRAAKGQLAPLGLHYEAMLPTPTRMWLYRFALARCHFDTAIDRGLVGPLTSLASALLRAERLLSRPRPRPIPSMEKTGMEGVPRIR